MNRFRSSMFITFCSLALAAAVATASMATATFAVAAGACSWAYDRAAGFLKSMTTNFAKPALVLVRQGAEKIQACAYALSIAKRERPNVSAGWRMCPSI